LAAGGVAAGFAAALGGLLVEAGFAASCASTIRASDHVTIPTTTV